MMTHTNSGVLDLMKNCIRQHLSSHIPRHTLHYLVTSSAVANMCCPSLPPELDSCLSFHMECLPNTPKFNAFFRDQLKKFFNDLSHNEETLYNIRPSRPVIHFGNEFYIILPH